MDIIKMLKEEAELENMTAEKVLDLIFPGENIKSSDDYLKAIKNEFEYLKKTELVARTYAQKFAESSEDFWKLHAIALRKVRGIK